MCGRHGDALLNAFFKTEHGTHCLALQLWLHASPRHWLIWAWVHFCFGTNSHFAEPTPAMLEQGPCYFSTSDSLNRLPWDLQRGFQSLVRVFHCPIFPIFQFASFRSIILYPPPQKSIVLLIQ